MKIAIKRILCFFALSVLIAISLCGCSASNDIGTAEGVNEISQLNGCDIGVQTGSTFDVMTDECIENAQKKYYESFADMTVAVKQGKISAFLVDEPLARMLCSEQGGIRLNHSQ